MIRFFVKGKGTPVPTYAPKKLVVSGLYRFVRNPMYVFYFLIITGYGIYIGSLATVIYSAILHIIWHLFVIFYEEVNLLKEFGEEYKKFCDNVPRWIPRLTAWDGK